MALLLSENHCFQCLVLHRSVFSVYGAKLCEQQFIQLELWVQQCCDFAEPSGEQSSNVSDRAFSLFMNAGRANSSTGRNLCVATIRKNIEAGITTHT